MQWVPVGLGPAAFHSSSDTSPNLPGKHWLHQLRFLVSGKFGWAGDLRGQAVVGGRGGTAGCLQITHHPPEILGVTEDFPECGTPREASFASSRSSGAQKMKISKC